ncbi:hypothetical protein Trydic_g5815 [Trypoxylus dichotomus]
MEMSTHFPRIVGLICIARINSSWHHCAKEDGGLCLMFYFSTSRSPFDKKNHGKSNTVRRQDQCSSAVLFRKKQTEIIVIDFLLPHPCRPV